MDCILMDSNSYSMDIHFCDNNCLLDYLSAKFLN